LIDQFGLDAGAKKGKMMATIVSSAPIAVLKARGGVELASYGSELEAVKAMLDCGSLGGLGSAYGSALHVSALIQVEAAIAGVRAAIKRQHEDYRAGGLV
jgi:hypothetical protein